MGLKEEIKKRSWQEDPKGKTYVALDDVLALLDRYELVAEYENGEVAFVRLWLKSDGPQDITQDICVEDAGCVYVYTKEASDELG